MPLPEAMIRRAIWLPAAESAGSEPVDCPARASFLLGGVRWVAGEGHRSDCES